MGYFERFIARRLIFSRRGNNAPLSNGTRPIVSITILGLVLGMAIMILAIGIVTGFQSEIRAKVIGFEAHLRITGHQAQNTLEPRPINLNQSFYPSLDTVPGVRHIQMYATKSGVLATDEEIHGVLVKGIGPDFDWSFFEQNKVAGAAFPLSDSARTNNILISQHIADKLRLAVDDHIVAVFIEQQKERKRKFTVAGIYDTGLEQLDQVVILADIKHIQRLNGWDNDQVSGFEVYLDSYENLVFMDLLVEQYLDDFQLRTTQITQEHPDIFGWLDLMDINVVLIISLMILVSSIVMISALLILILERTNMIGILKALGATNWSIQTVFLYQAFYLIGVGLFWGNLLGITLGWIQQRFGLITLSPESYYIEQVPVTLDVLPILLLNIGTLVLCFLMLVIPSYVVTKISPVKTIQFN